MQTADRNLSPAALARDAREVDREARAGSEAAWHDLFTYYYPRVFRLLCSRIGEPAAEELARVVFLRAHARVTEPPPTTTGGRRPPANGASPIEVNDGESDADHADHAPPSTAGHVILAAARDVLRERVAGGPLGEPDASTGAPAHPLGLVHHDYLDPRTRDALATLPRDARMALELRYVVGLTASEAAVVLDMHPDALTALTHRAARALREVAEGM